MIYCAALSVLTQYLQELGKSRIAESGNTKLRVPLAGMRSILRYQSIEGVR
jgi:hypothetical protein